MNGKTEEYVVDLVEKVAKFMGETNAQISNLINDVQENVNVTKSVEKEVGKLSSAYEEQKKQVVGINERLYVLDNPKNGLINTTIDETTKNTATVKILRIFMVTILVAFFSAGGTVLAKVVFKLF